MEYLSFEKTPEVNYAKFLDYNLLSENKDAKLKRHVGLVSERLLLIEEKSISENLKFYKSSIGSKVDMTPILKELGLLNSKKVSEYNDHKKILIKIAVLLAKNPDLLIIDNPQNQLDIGEYKNMMSSLQNIASSTGVGVLVILSNMDIVNLFPGRSF